MFSLADPATVSGLLERAGFTDVTVSEFETPMLLPAGERSTKPSSSSWLPESAERMFDIAEPAAAAAALDAVRSVLAEHHDGDGVRLGASAWLVTARRG